VIVDTSALLTILQSEPDSEACASAIASVAGCRMSAANFLEAAIVVDSARDPVASRRLDELIDLFGIVIEPVTPEQARIGRAAYRDFGKGSGHPAQLNYGDCFAYALAKVTAEPLLFVGHDFARTDVRVARSEQP
jgi:ribonuclease VapC